MSEKVVSFSVGGRIAARRESICYSKSGATASRSDADSSHLQTMMSSSRTLLGFYEGLSGMNVKTAPNATRVTSSLGSAQTPMHMCCSTQNKSVIESSLWFLYILELSNHLRSFLHLIWSTLFCQNQLYARWSTTGWLKVKHFWFCPVSRRDSPASLSQSWLEKLLTVQSACSVNWLWQKSGSRSTHRPIDTADGTQRCLLSHSAPFQPQHSSDSSVDI